MNFILHLHTSEGLSSNLFFYAPANSVILTNYPIVSSIPTSQLNEEEARILLNEVNNSLEESGINGYESRLNYIGNILQGARIALRLKEKVMPETNEEG